MTHLAPRPPIILPWGSPTQSVKARASVFEAVASSASGCSSPPSLSMVNSHFGNPISHDHPSPCTLSKPSSPADSQVLVPTHKSSPPPAVHIHIPPPHRSLVLEQEQEHAQAPPLSPPSPHPRRSLPVALSPCAVSRLALLVHDVSLALFEVQELRHAAPPDHHPSPSVPAAHHHSRCFANHSALTPLDRALVNLEDKASLVPGEIAALLPRQASTSAILSEKLEDVLNEWHQVESDMSTLKEELKEDKWLVVFRTVSAQAEEMMDSLEKVCGLVDDFLLSNHQFLSAAHSHPDGASSRQLSCSPGPPDKVHDRRSKSRRRNDGCAVTDDLDVCSTQRLEAYDALRKSFEAKRKHYAPSCSRVLGILSKGIESRSTKNGQVLRRYSDMKTRFGHLQRRIARLEQALGHLGHAFAASDQVSSLSSLFSLGLDLRSSPPMAHRTPISPPSSGFSATVAPGAKRSVSSIVSHLASSSPPPSTSPPIRKISSQFRPLAAGALSTSSSKAPSVCSASGASLVLQPAGRSLGQAGSQLQSHHSRSAASVPSLSVIDGTRLRPSRTSSKLDLVTTSRRTSGHGFSPPTLAPAPPVRPATSLVIRPQSSFGTACRAPRAGAYHSSLSGGHSSLTVSRPKTEFGPATGSSQALSAGRPANNKPRWNISLKPVVDRPLYISAPVAGSSVTTATVAKKTGVGSSTPGRYRPGTSTMTRSQTPASLHYQQPHHQDSKSHFSCHADRQPMRSPLGYISQRPSSAAGQSDVSGMTMVSAPLGPAAAGGVYRSRPVSRASRIPAPVWDPCLAANKLSVSSSLSLSRPASRIEQLQHPHQTRLQVPLVAAGGHQTKLRNALASPTASEMEMMVGLSKVVKEQERHKQQDGGNGGVATCGGGGGAATKQSEINRGEEMEELQ